MISGCDTKSTSIRSKNQQVELHQTKMFLHSKICNQQNEKATIKNGRRYLQTIYLIRNSYSKYLRNSYNSKKNVKKTNNHIEKLAKNSLNGIFFPKKIYIQMANSYMKTCSMSLIIREIQTQTIMRITSPLLEWLLSKTRDKMF